jgi:hypothetical protein
MKSILSYLMKTYHALDKFSKKVNEGSVEIINEDFYNKKITFITYEEINESSETQSVEKTSTPGT